MTIRAGAPRVRRIAGSVTLALGAMALLGAALWGPGRLAGRLAAGGAAVVGAATLLQYALAANFGIDQLLFRDLTGGLGDVRPGRMAVNTALAVTLLGIAVLLAPAGAARLRRLAEATALGAGVLALLALVGYTLGEYTFSGGVGGLVSMAVPTSLGLVAAAAGAIAAVRDGRLRALYGGDSLGGAVARRMGPLVVVVPVALAWVRLRGEEAGWYDTRFGVALYAVATVVLLAAAVLWNARELDRIEGARAAAHAALRDNEQRLRGLFEGAAAGVAEVSLEGRFLRLNRAFCELVGYTAAEMAQLTFQDITHPDDLASDLEQVRRLLAGEVSSYALEKRYIRKNGAPVWINLTASVVRGADGAPKYFVAVVDDVSARKRTEAALARSNADLERFAYVASHDLREPLRMVANFVQLLAERYKGRLDADADEFIGYAVDGAQRMRRMIDDLLAYSRVGGGAYTPVPTDATAALAAAVADAALAIAEARAVITRDALPVVPAQPGQLERVFANLIGNALKFRRAAPPHVHVGAARRDHGWVFTVRDNGIGIDPQYFDRIFVIFQRLHTATEYPGTGMGLAITKRIIERHGGRLWVESTRGIGSTFHFFLPGTGEAAA